MADYTITDLVRSAASAAITGQAVQADADIPAAGLGPRVFVRAVNTEAQALTLVFGAGATGLNAGQGTLTVTVTQNQVKYITLETARFAKATGDINILGTIAAGGTLGNAKLEIMTMPI